METSICLLLYWAINLKQDREHHPRPLCWLELGRLIDRGGGGMGRGGEREKEKTQALDKCRDGERMGRGSEKEREGERRKMREKEGGRPIRKEKGSKGKE